MKTTSIRFYHNGLRLNGSRALVKCSYSLDNSSRISAPCVTISAERGASLPRDLFPVENETDLMTDYFDADHATITADHPLYPFARAAAVKWEIYLENISLRYAEKRTASGNMADYYAKEAARIRARVEQLTAELAALPSEQPSAADLDAVAAQNLEAENARRRAEQEAQQAQREKELRRRSAGRRFIAEAEQAHSITPDSPYVEIPFSENPAFYAYNDQMQKNGEPLRLSVAAAEEIIKHFDTEISADAESGYDKTDFVIHYTDETGEPSTYEGRYDLGCNDGGLIPHIRQFGENLASRGHFCNGQPTEQDAADAAAILALADLLDAEMSRTTPTPPTGGKVVTVDFTHSSAAPAPAEQATPEPGTPTPESAPTNPETAPAPEQQAPDTGDGAESAEQPPKASPLYGEISEETARRAKEMNSFSDYRPGSATADYRAAVDKAAALVERKKSEVSPFYHEKLDALLKSYARRLAAWTNDYNRNAASCPSVLISGTGNFPTRKKARQNAREDSLWAEYQKIEALLDKIRTVGTGPVDKADPHAREILTDRINRHREALEQAKAANAYYKKHKTLTGCPGFTPEQAADLTDPDSFDIRVHGVPFPPYELASLRRKIRFAEQRIAELDKLTAEAKALQNSTKFPGGEIVRNAELNRLQILFDEIPDADTRAALKEHGFRWSPKNQAWQRQLTDNAVSAARAALGIA
mgnify:CR=1 FL=1